MKCAAKRCAVIHSHLVKEKNSVKKQGDGEKCVVVGYLRLLVSWAWNPRWIRRCREGNGRGGGVKRRRSGGALCGRRRLPWCWGSEDASHLSKATAFGCRGWTPLRVREKRKKRVLWWEYGYMVPLLAAHLFYFLFKIKISPYFLNHLPINSPTSHPQN